MEKLELLLEAERRGILPPEKARLLDVARQRGLVPGGPSAAQPAPGPGGVPDGMFLDPNTGSYTSREMMANNMDRDRSDAAISGGFQGMSFGFGDEMAGGMAALHGLAKGQDMGDAYAAGRERARAATELDREQFPGTSLAAEVAGAVAVPMGPLAGMARGASLPAKIGAGAATGAGLSGLYGFGASEGGAGERSSDAAQAMALGAILGGSIPLAGAGVNKILDSRAANRAIAQAAKGAPSDAELKAMANAAYKQVDDMGVAVMPDKYDDMAREIKDYLLTSGVDTTDNAFNLTPGSKRVMQIVDEVGDPASNGVPWSAMDRFRQQVGTVAQRRDNPADARLATGAIDIFDDFVNNLDSSQLTGGNADQLGPTLEKARSLWKRLRKSEKINELLETSDGYLSGDASGIRNKFSAILKNPKQRAKFTDVELKAMKNAIDGTGLDFLARQAGRLGIALNSGGSNSLGAVIGMLTGGAVGGLPGALAAGAAGTAAKAYSNARTESLAKIARDLIAAGKLKSLPAPKPDRLMDLEQLLRQGGAAALN